MELTFIGRGAAFNPKEGNTSAYFIENNQLFLIDCGESVFERLLNTGILDSVDGVNVLITHTHSDHIGSIGSLVMYFYYVRHMTTNIVLPKVAKYIENIKAVLFGFGCTNDMYNYIEDSNFDNNYSSFNSFRYIETDHCDSLNCYSIVFKTDKGIIFYSGDTRELNVLNSVIQNNDNIYRIYIDTNISGVGTGHIGVDDLHDFIPTELIDKTYCMHINNDECLKKAKEYGFNIVELGKN